MSESTGIVFEHDFSMPKCPKCGQSFTAPGFCGGCDLAPVRTLSLANGHTGGGSLGAVAFQPNAATPSVRYEDGRILLVCAGRITQMDEGATLDDAQTKAAFMAHFEGADVYILKPVRKVSPTRDVVTTEL